MNQKMTNIGLGIVFIGVLVIGFFQFQKSDKSAYIDINVLLSEYKGMIDVQKEIELKTKKMDANIDTLIQDWENELRMYEKERTLMTKKEQQLKEELLRNKQQQINNYREVVKQQATAEDNKLRQNVIDEINQYIEEYGEELGYEYIYGASGSGNILYASKKKDITQIIIDNLNKKFNRIHNVIDE